eukprot:GHRQ01037631.1.p1 GENE.GHRQ01037631.1~~GHRQ01037631.1.p1  ORF type:complete len:148 (+),score=59.42 GHRQ01037631.1:215-658(+)
MAWGPATRMACCHCLGGTYGGSCAASLQDCSHAVLRHKQQAAYTAARELGCIIATAEWVLLSAVRQQLQPQEDDGLLPGPAIPGFAGHVRQVTLSAITGMDRGITRYKVECSGAAYSADMPLSTTSHVMTTSEACRVPSKKIETAAA